MREHKFLRRNQLVLWNANILVETHWSLSWIITLIYITNHFTFILTSITHIKMLISFMVKFRQSLVCGRINCTRHVIHDHCNIIRHSNPRFTQNDPKNIPKPTIFCFFNSWLAKRLVNHATLFMIINSILLFWSIKFV